MGPETAPLEPRISQQQLPTAGLRTAGERREVLIKKSFESLLCTRQTLVKILDGSSHSLLIALPGTDAVIVPFFQQGH